MPNQLPTAPRRRISLSHRSALVVAVLLAAFVSPTAGATIAVIPAMKDNTLYQTADGSLSNGAGQHFFAGRTGQPAGQNLRRGLLAFDIAGNVPSGFVIQSVELTLHVSQAQFGAQTITLHRLLADWGEAGSQAGGGEGMGGLAQEGDATWLHTFSPDEFWDAPGGDFVATASAGQAVDLQGFYTWSSAAMAADVQGWLDDPAANFGWLLLGNEAVGGTSKRFDSRENVEPDLRPALTVTYVIPEPSGVVLALVGSAIFIIANRIRRATCT